MKSSKFPSPPGDFPKRFSSLDEFKAYQGQIKAYLERSTPEKYKPEQIRKHIAKTPDELKKDKFISEVIPHFHKVADELAGKLKPLVEQLELPPPKPPKLPGRPSLPWDKKEIEDTPAIYDGFFKVYKDKLKMPVTLHYLDNAKVLHIGFQEVSGFDWGLVGIELGKAFEEEFHPVFCQLAKPREKDILEDFCDEKAIRKAQEKYPSLGPLEAMSKSRSFGLWIAVLSRYYRKFEKGKELETILDDLNKFKSLRDKSAHAQDDPFEAKDANTMRNKLLLLQPEKGLLPIILDMSLVINQNCVNKG